VHFVSPRIIPRQSQNPCAARLIFFIERGHVLHANPDPGARVSLATLAKINARCVTAHAGEEIAALIRNFETERFNIIPDADGHLSNAQDRIRMFEFCLHISEV
jgi:hypothetical protein